MSDNSKVLATFFGDNKYPVTWKDEQEKKLMWFYDDLHCPHPISPLYFDVGGWWGPGCEYMYRRFGAPIGSEWIAKKIGGYVYSAVVPPKIDEDKVGGLFSYYLSVMPIYADTFLETWKKSYLPEILKNYEYMDSFKYEGKSISELLIHMEDCLDIQDRHFKIHWILNLAQFQASTEFSNVYAEVLGEADSVMIGRINISRQDRNWDSLKALWDIKEFICSVPELKALLSESTPEIKEKVAATEKGDQLLKLVTDYQDEFGYKAIYTHEYIYKTWKEDPAPIYDALRGYVETDYNYFDDYNACIAGQKKAIEHTYAQVKDPEKLEKLKKYLELCVKMAPLTPDHHFYIDQGTYSRMRLMFLEIGKAFVKAGKLDDPEDIFMLEYEEIRVAGVSDYDVKGKAKTRRAEMAEAKKIHPKEWYGTATEWQVFQEPYKGLWGYPQKFEAEQAESNQEISKTVVKGIPGSPGVVEGIARFVTSPAEFDQIQKGDILICKMTNPAWVVSFSKIAGLVTDTGGALSHPAVVSREFGLPCVVGTRRATHMIKTGAKIRVDGNKGIVEIL